MLALSLWQPWAWYVVEGYKAIENRPWRPPSKLIGKTFLLHAAKRQSEDERRRAALLAAEASFLRSSPPPPPALLDLPTGGIVGVGRVVGVLEPAVARTTPAHHTAVGLAERKHALGWWMRAQYGWVLDDVRPLPFVELRGMQRLFRVPDDVVAKLGLTEKEMQDAA